MSHESGKVIDFYKAAGRMEVQAVECSCGQREFVLTADHRIYCRKCRSFLEAEWRPNEGKPAG